MLFIDFSSAFNTIIPQQLINKLNLLGLNASLCNWILDFLTGRPQSVRVGHKTSSTTTLSTGAPQGCVLSLLLFTLLTHDCTDKFISNHIIKFADDTTVVGLISNNDETPYREEVAQLVEWCGANNLSLNVSKTKEVVMDFRRNSVDHSPLTIDSSTVERVSSTKFLGLHITEDLTWTTNTTSFSKKAQQRLHFLRRLKRASLPPPILTTFYRGTIESVLTSCITVWYGNCSVADRKNLQRTVNTAAKIIGAPLPSIPWTFSLHDAPVKLPVLWKTPPIPPTVSSSSCHQEDGTGASEPAPPDCSTAFSPRLWEPSIPITSPPSETSSTPPPHPIPPHHTTPHHTTPHHTTWKQLKTSRTLCNSECATHR